MKSKRFRTMLIITLLGMFCLSNVAFGKSTTIRWWSGNWSEDRAKELIRQFELENPDIRIEADFIPWEGYEERVTVALRGANPPDIVDITNTWSTSFAAMNLLLPIDEYLWADFDESVFFESTWQTTQLQGHTYGLPYRLDVMALMYNLDMLAEASLPERAPDTWDEILEFSKTLTKDTSGDGQIDQFGWGIVGSNVSNVIFRVVPLIWQNGGDILNKDNTASVLHESPAVEAVQFYADLFSKYAVTQRTAMSDNAQEVDRLFVNKRVALHMTGPWIIPLLEEQAPDLKFHSGPFARRDDESDNRVAVMGGWNIAIAKKAANPEAAAKFLEFFIRPENVAYYTETLPAVIKSFDDPRFGHPALAGFIEQADYMRALPLIPEWTQIQRIIYDEVQEVMYGRKDAQRAMNDATVEIDRLLAK